MLAIREIASSRIQALKQISVQDLIIMELIGQGYHNSHPPIKYLPIGKGI
jgi:hypothetical protein